MNLLRLSSRFSGLFAGLLFATTCLVLAPTPARAAAAADTVTVDKNQAGPYKALADLSMEAVKAGNYPRAITLARILELVWDTGSKDFEQKAGDKFTQIDDAMDNFIRPILGSTKKAPDDAALDAAYKAYVEKLKLMS